MQVTWRLQIARRCECERGCLSQHVMPVLNRRLVQGEPHFTQCQLGVAPPLRDPVRDKWL